jgi:archaellin
MDDNTLDIDIADGGLYGFTGRIGPNEVAEIDIDVSTYALVPYGTFIVEIVPPTGASIQIQRTLPGEFTTVINLY